MRLKENISVKGETNMMTKKTIVKIISGVVIGGTLLSIGGLAFANNVTTNTTGELRGGFPGKAGMTMQEKGGMRGGPGKMMAGNMQEGMQSMLKELVASGSITQEKADQLTSYMTKKEEERKAQFEKFKSMTPEERKAQLEANKEQIKGKRVDLFGDVVAQGILTQQEADNIKKKIVEINETKRKNNLSDTLNGLIEKGTINVEQKDKILKYFDVKEAQMKEVMDKVKDMTPEQRRDYIKENMGDRKDPIGQLVDDGTITKEQAQEISKALGHRGPGFGGFKGGRPGMKQGFDKGAKRPLQSGQEQK